MPEELPAPLHIVLPTDLVFVRPGRKMIECLLRAQVWADEDVEDAALVATELIQNAIEHGSRGDGRETADVLVDVCSDALILEVSDPGTGKDPRLLLERDVTQPIPLDAPRGRGLFLINRLAQRLERTQDEAGGCHVRVRLECSTS